MNQLALDAFENVISVSEALFKNEQLITQSKKTVEESVRSIEQRIVQNKDPALVIKYFELVFSEGMYWLSSSKQSEKERIAWYYLSQISLSAADKKSLLNGIRNTASKIHANDTKRILSIAFHARDLLFGTFPYLIRT